MSPALVADALVERVLLDERSWVDVVRGFVTDADEAAERVLTAHLREMFPGAETSARRPSSPTPECCGR